MNNTENNSLNPTLQQPMRNKEELFGKCLDKMFEIYKRKNKDYTSGNKSAFEKSFERFQLTSSAVRLGDKYERVCAYAEKGLYAVEDEGVEDTLLDLANYAILTLVEIIYNKQKKESGI